MVQIFGRLPFFFHRDNSYEGGMSQNRGEVIEGSLRRN